MLLNEGTTACRAGGGLASRVAPGCDWFGSVGTRLACASNAPPPLADTPADRFATYGPALVDEPFCSGMCMFFFEEGETVVLPVGPLRAAAPTPSPSARVNTSPADQRATSSSAAFGGESSNTPPADVYPQRRRRARAAGCACVLPAGAAAEGARAPRMPRPTLLLPAPPGCSPPLPFANAGRQ